MGHPIAPIPIALDTSPQAPPEHPFVVSGRRFHLLELIGRGSFGDVYLAEQESEGGFRRKVVLKLLNEQLATRRGSSRQMRNEARILGLLLHRHIVGVLDLVRFEDRWAILMDWIPGADLERVLDAVALVENEHFPVRAALEVGAAVGEALHAAFHTSDGAGGLLSVVHRDVKPSNVQLTPDGEIKVLDFGVARFSLDERADTSKRTWIGTERYMAPERLRYEGDTAAGDVYAAAASVVELILGRPLGRTPVEPQAHAAFVEEALGLVRIRVDADPATIGEVVAMLRAALHADPARRPTAAVLAASLEDLSGRVRGESLKQFSRRFVPAIDRLLGRRAVPADGVLHEGTTSRSLLLDTPDEAASPVSNPTISFPPPSDPGYPRSSGETLVPRPGPTPIAVPPRAAVAVCPAPEPVPPSSLRRAIGAIGAVGRVADRAIVGSAVVLLLGLVALVILVATAGSARVAERPAASAPKELRVPVSPGEQRSFERTMLGAPLFPGSSPELGGTVVDVPPVASEAE